MDGLTEFTIKTTVGERDGWWAEDREHAIEQFLDAIPDEIIIEVYPT